MNIELINPFVTSTHSVFSTMLGCTLDRGELRIASNFHPQHEISGIIGLSGDSSGSVVVSMESNVALQASAVLVGEAADEVNEFVIDTVGELTNMIAGQAKCKLKSPSMEIALPTVIVGKNHMIRFGSDIQPITIPFECEWGKISIEVGFAGATCLV